MTKQQDFDEALFKFEYIIKTMIAHPDWSAADVKEVVDNQWLDYLESKEESLLISEPEYTDGREDSYLMDRENAQHINRGGF